MSNRRDYYFRQKVTEAELDAGFNALEQADFNFSVDNDFTGIVDGMVVSEKSGTPNLSVDVQGPGTAYSKQGERINFSATQNVDVSQDDGGTPTTVGTPGNTKVVSVFIEFDRALSDPRIDGNSLTVYFQRDESFDFSVVQGAEALIGTEVPPPIDVNKTLLADIRIENGTTQILNSHTVGAYDQIDFTRREDAFKFAGGTIEIIKGNAYDSIDSLLAALNDHIDGAANVHPASQVSYSDIPVWLNGQTLDGSTDVDDVQEAIAAVLTDLAKQAAGDSGVHRVGAVGQTAGTESVATGSVYSQIGQIIASLALKAPLAGTNVFTGTSNTFDNIVYVGDKTDFTNVSTAIKLWTPKLQLTPPASTLPWKRICLFRSVGFASIDSEVNGYIVSADSSYGEGFEIAINCRWGSFSWTKQDTSFNSYLIHFGNKGIRFYRRATGTNWLETEWHQLLLDVQDNTGKGAVRVEDGKYQFTNATSAASADVANPTQATTPTVNALYAKNTCKSWAYVSIDASGNILSIDGFNVNTPSNPGASANLDITFKNALDSEEFAVVCSDVTGENVNEIPTLEATTGFRMERNDADTGTVITRDVVHQCCFIVFGTDS